MSRLAPLLLWIIVAAPMLAWPDGAPAEIDPAGRPVAEVQIEGLQQVPEQFVRNHIRVQPGDPYDQDIVQQDIVRLTHLDRFDTIRVQIEPRDDGSLTLIYRLQEQPLLADVQVVGNRALTDQFLLDQVRLQSGDPITPFLIEEGRRRINEIYEERGYFVAEVEIDRQLLEQDNILVYRVREGPRVRIRQIQFQGNEVFDRGQLMQEIASRTWIPVFRRAELSREQLDLDAASIRQLYNEHGYLDAQVGRRIELSPDQQDAIVTFIVEEGPQYLVDAIRIDGAQLVPAEQILRFMELNRGDVFTREGLQDSQQSLRALYGRLGYLESDVTVERLFHEEDPRVDLLVEVHEGVPSTVGRLSIRGNEGTQDRVVLREVRGMEPGRRLDGTGIEATERRLRQSPIFASGTVSVLGQPDDEFRDVIIEVEEQDTGSINLGVGVSSDLGLIGSVSLIQRNFDIAGFPDSGRDLLTGQAFHGAGQYFQLSLQPGTEFSEYSINFREPALFDSDYFLDTEAFYFNRDRRDYSERRVGGSVGIGQRFGDVWSAALQTRGQEVAIRRIDPDAATDVFDVEGFSAVTGLGLTLERNTTDSRIFPTEGGRMQLTGERVGALGGDFDFTRLETHFRQFWTVDEDFFGRRSTVSFRLETGYIVEDDRAPVFERFYAGGHRSFRGFEFRGMGPLGVRAQTGEPTRYSVGGEFKLLTGLEYQFPLWGMPDPGENMAPVNAVVFTDMGTVRNSPGLRPWRVSVGGGFRIKVPFLGEAPFALDFAYPIVKESGDRNQIISFDLAMPLP